MKLRYPDYYEKFHCIADKCEDTCCAGWEIDIDDESYDFYMQVHGKFGERLRENIKEYRSEVEDIYEKHGFLLKAEKRCPFLNQNNLCDIILEFGDSALCYVCTHTPRNYFEYRQMREISISPSCPEAARLIFWHKEPVRFLWGENEEPFLLQESEEDLLLAEMIYEAGNTAVFLLQNRSYDIFFRMCQFLLFAKEVQDRLNQEKQEGIIPWIREVREGKWKLSLQEVSKEQDGLQYQNFLLRMELFSELDCINEAWEHKLERIRGLFLEGLPVEDVPEECIPKKRYLESLAAFHIHMKEKQRIYELEQFAVYYASLMLPRAVDDENFWGKAQFVAVSFLMFQDMNVETFDRNMQEFTTDDLCENARIFAKEVEHSQENMELLEEEFLFEESYGLESLLAVLYREEERHGDGL